MPVNLTPTQRRTLVRIVDASGVWRHYVYVDTLGCKAGAVGALVRRGLLDRIDGIPGIRLARYRPTVRGVEVARGREMV